MPLNDFHKPKREPPLSLRLTFAERAFLEKKAGSQSLSSYIKGELFTANPSFGLGLSGAPQRTPRHDQKLLAQILAKLGESELSLSLNELSRAAATGSLFVSEQVEAHLAQACADVAEIRVLLLEALGKRRKAAPPKPKTLTEAFNLGASGFIKPRIREMSP